MPAPDPPAASGTTADPAGDRRSWFAVLAAFAVAGATVGSFGARLVPAVRAGLDLGDGALGTALLGTSIGAVAGAWLGGIAERRCTSRPVIVVSWAALGAALAVPALMPTWATLAAALLAMGLAMGVLDVSMNAAAVVLERRAGRPLMSGLHAGWSGGLLAGAALGAVGVATEVDPRVHLATVGALLSVGVLVWWRRLPRGFVPTKSDGSGANDLAGDVDGGAGAGRARAASPWRMAALAAIGGCVFLGEGAAIDWSAVLVDDALDGSALLGSLAVTGVSAGGLAGRVVGDRLVGRFGATRVVRRGATMASLGMAAALAAGSPVLAPVLLFCFGFGLASAVPLAFGAAGRASGSRGIAVVTTAGYGAYMAGPALIGGLAEAVGLRTAMGVPVVLAAAVVALAWSIGADTEPKPELAPPLGAAD